MHRRRRNSSWNFWKKLLLILLLAILMFMGVMPLVEAWLPYNPLLSLRMEWMRSRIMETVIATWFFSFGSMVGSFINVVVWRMPRGVSVVAQGSACPYCRARIRMSDNIPIFGWLKLGGRCRVCRLPISPRYPIVEAIFGVVFLILFLVTVPTSAGNLPGGPRYNMPGILQNVISTKWDVIGFCAFHMTLLTMLLAWALMQFDKSRLPIKSIVFALLVGFAAPAFFDYLHPVPWLLNREQWLIDLSVINRFDTGFVGVAAGFLTGEFLDQFSRQKSLEPPRGYFKASLMTIGLFLGWQALITTLAIFGVLLWIAKGFQRCSQWARRIPAIGWLALATLVQICLWRSIHETVPITLWSDAGYWVPAVLGLALVLLALHPESRAAAPQSIESIEKTEK